MIQGMSQAGRPVNPEVARSNALMQQLDDLLARPKAPMSAQPPAPVAPTTLLDEVAARAELAKPIDWRTTDAVPITPPRKGIILGGESTPGLQRMLEEALMNEDRTLVEQIQKAQRQRAHINGKVGQ
jgi:hypothetical protein